MQPEEAEKPRPVSAKSKKAQKKAKEQKAKEDLPIVAPKKVPEEPNYFVEELKNSHEIERPKTDIDSVIAQQAREDEILYKKRKADNRKNTTNDL